jgi:hypothetical protein
MEMARFEDVSQQHDTVAGVALLDTGFDFGPAILHIVLGANADGADVTLRTHHVLHGGA